MMMMMIKAVAIVTKMIMKMRIRILKRTMMTLMIF